MKIKLFIFVAMVLNTISGFSTYAGTNFVSVTTNLTFFLNRFSSEPANLFQSDELIHYTLCQNKNPLIENTNSTYIRYFPFESSFEFNLIDEKGKNVSKTSLGDSNSKKPKNPIEFLDLRSRGIRWTGQQLFRADNMFKIRKPGTYELEVRIRICVPMTNGIVDSAAMLDLHKFVSSKEFGIVVSDPVRVKVIKK